MNHNYRPYLSIHDQARRKETRREILKAICGILIIVAITITLIILGLIILRG